LEVVSTEAVGNDTPDCSENQPGLPDGTEGPQRAPAEASPAPSPAARPDAFTDDEILPVFEADLDLPHLAVAGVIAPKNASSMEENQ
jgi:hypothetical protein